MNSTIDEVASAVRRESARRKRVTANLARLGYAMDAQMAELSAEELASHALKPLGLPIGNDPVMALDYYLAGLQQGARGPSGVQASGMDGAPPEGSFLAKYLNSNS